MDKKNKIRDELYIVGLIPARGGSKGIKNKNIKELNGKPLIQYSIEQSVKCDLIDETIVTTDSPVIAKISKDLGAKVPFLRPKEISDDKSTDYEFMEHYVNYLMINNKKMPDLIVQLRPTCPNRTVTQLNNSIKTMIDNFDLYDSLRSVIKFEKSPYKMYIVENNNLVPLFKTLNGKKEPYNLSRQELPQAYIHNGYIDIIKTDTIIKKKSITGDKILPYVMDLEEIIDIDTYKDWDKFASIMGNNKK